MIVDCNNHLADVKGHFDVCIIGGGPAGIALALELGDQDYTVCLVESGGLKINHKNQRLNEIDNIGLPYEDLSVQRGRFLGGSTNFWGGNCIPMDAIDFRPCKGREDFSWPFSHAILEPYVLKAQSLLGINTSPFGDTLLKKLDLSNNKNHDILFEWKAWQFCDFPFRFGDKFHKPLSTSSQITLYLNANFVNLKICEGERTAKSAVIKNLSGKSGLIDASIFVLACGGIENARILLNLVDMKTLEIEEKQHSIGKYFAEHPNATIGYLKGKGVTAVYEKHKIKYLGEGKEIKPGLSIIEGLQDELGILNGIVSVWPVPLENSAITRAKLLLYLFRKKEFGLKFLINTFSVVPSVVSLLPHVPLCQDRCRVHFSL